jgi:hypothetical protein
VRPEGAQEVNTLPVGEPCRQDCGGASVHVGEAGRAVRRRGLVVQDEEPHLVGDAGQLGDLGGLVADEDDQRGRLVGAGECGAQLGADAGGLRPVEGLVQGGHRVTSSVASWWAR